MTTAPPDRPPGYYLEPVYRKTEKFPNGWPPDFEPLPPDRQTSGHAAAGPWAFPHATSLFSNIKESKATGSPREPQESKS